MSFRWETSLNMNELWLNSDREILARAATTAEGKYIRLTVELPSGEHFAADVDALNAETGGAYCANVRGYYNEWKKQKEAESSRRKDRAGGGTLLDAKGQQLRREPEEGASVVSKAVEALEADIPQFASLEEDLAYRLDRAVTRRGAASARRDAADREIAELEKEIEQLEQFLGVLNASKILEKASVRVHQESQSEPSEPQPVGEGLGSPKPKRKRSRKTQRRGD